MRKFLIMAYQCVRVCDLWLNSEIRDQLTCHSHVCACRDLSETHTAHKRANGARSSCVHSALCSVKGTVVSLCVCVCLTYTHRLPSHLKRCCLGDGVRRTGSSMITWQEKRGTLKEQRRETESTACSTLIMEGGGGYHESHTEKFSELECLPFTKFHIISVLMLWVANENVVL